MSSYYKKIDGVDYDKAMLDAADESIKGRGDGRISHEDAKALFEKMKDGGKITDTELRTLDYIYKHYKLTDAALKYIEESLAEYKKSGNE